MNRLVEFRFGIIFPLRLLSPLKNPKNCKKLSKSNISLSIWCHSFDIEIESVGHGKWINKTSYTF